MKTLMTYVTCLLCICLSACATKAKVDYETKTTDPATGVVDSIHYSAVASAAPFAKLNDANQNFGFDKESLTVGNHAQGMDNTTQLQGLQMGMGMFTEILHTVAPMIAAGQVKPPAVDTGDANAGLCEYLCKIPPALADKLPPMLKQARDNCGCN